MTKEVVKRRETKTVQWRRWVQDGPQDDPYGHMLVIQAVTGDPSNLHIGPEWGPSLSISRDEIDAWIELLEAAREG